MRYSIKELCSKRWAPINQPSLVEALFIGLYISLILITLDYIGNIFLAYPSWLIVKLNDGTSLANQILINKWLIIFFATLVVGAIHQRHSMDKDFAENKKYTHRIKLPKEKLKKLNFREGDSLNAKIAMGGILLKNNL